MTVQRTLDQFSLDLLQSVLSRSEAEDAEQFRAESFTATMIDYLTDLGAVDAGEVCYHKAHGLEVSGYDVSSEQDRIDLFATIFTQSSPPAAIPKADIEGAVRRAVAFFKKCQRQYHKTMEESSPVYDMAQTVAELAPSLTQLRITVLTDGISKLTTVQEADVDGIQLVVQVWDIERLYRAVESGLSREPNDIDFVERFGRVVPCLSSPAEAGSFDTYLAMIPGSVLASVYAEFGTRLLERNVRAFLQARGGVNKGIKKTIMEHPEMFLAYNNGISATADSVEFGKTTEGSLGVKRLVDLQIVNGGQTTASLYHAMQKDKADLSRVFVQMKLTIVPPEQVSTVVPLISRYANTQNKIQEADFSVSHPFHIAIESLSRTVWAPPVDGSQRQTRWFYERARGQYQDAKGRASIKAFEAECPKEQMFTKTDLANVEHSWDQLPHIVSRHAQKNFREFMLRLDRRGTFEPDQAYFEKLVGKLILFNRAWDIVSSLKFPAYRPNVVTYAIAYVCHHTAQSIDLGQVWRDQALPQPLTKTIESIAPAIYASINDAPAGGNVGEWCKKEACWDRVRGLELPLDKELVSRAASRSANGVSPQATSAAPLSPTEQALVDRMAAVEAEEWFGIAKWAKSTSNLQGWQRKIAFSLGTYAATKKPPSIKQAVQGEKILEEARRLGFKQG